MPSALSRLHKPRFSEGRRIPHVELLGFTIQDLRQGAGLQMRRVEPRGCQLGIAKQA